MYANDYIIDVDHRDYGPVRWVGVPTTFSETPNRSPPAKGESWHAPYIGEHSRSVLIETLGYSPAEADALMQENVVPAPGGMRAIETSRAAREKYAAKMRRRRMEVDKE